MPLRIFCLLIGLVASPAFAQDPFGNPFGGSSSDPSEAGANPFGQMSPDSGSPFGTESGNAAPGGGFGFAAPATPQPSAAGAAVTEKDPDPVVRMLRESPPTTPEEMAQALTWVSRLQRWDEARRLLDRLAGLGWSDEQKAQLAREAGAGLWIRLRGDEMELTEAQQALVRDIAGAPSRLARDPNWIEQWINKLASDSAGERELAQLRLQDAGSAGVERLVDRLLTGEGSVPGGMLAKAVASFGSRGENALQAAALVNDPNRAGRVLLALVEVPGNKFTAVLGGGLYSRLLTETDREQLTQRLSQKFDSLPDEQAVHDFLVAEFERRLASYFIDRQKLAQVDDEVWQLTPDGLGIQSKLVPASQVALERVAQAAVLRLRLDLVTQDDALEAGTTLLQRAYQANSTLEAAEMDPVVAAALPEKQAQTPDFWRAVFEQANAWQLHGAALRALQAYTQVLPPGSPVPQFLSDLLDDPRPMIRYSAMEAVSQLDPQVAYSGSEQAIRTALEMASLGNGPHVLVIGLSSDLRQAAEQQLGLQAGATVSQAQSARDALLVLADQRPVEWIVIVDRVGDLSLFELFQRLRNSAKGQSLPIAVLTDKLYQHEREWISETGGVVKSVLSRDPEHMRRIVNQLQDSLDTRPLNLADRGWFAQVASQFLTRILGDRETYAFYPVDQWQSALLEAADSLPGSSKTSMLVGLGTKASQLELFELAADPAKDESQRIAAAQAFGASVRSHGMLLQRDDVTRTYRVYNELGPTDNVAVRSLGYILDVIEAQAGKAAWPKPLQ